MARKATAATVSAMTEQPFAARLAELTVMAAHEDDYRCDLAWFLEGYAPAILALMEWVPEVLSDCDDSEAARGYCVGHGGITRLPCPFAELRAKWEALK